MDALSDLRAEIDAVDARLVALFERRMALARRIAACKRAHGLPVRDAAREARMIESRAQALGDARLAPALGELFETLLRLSRAEQEHWLLEKEAGG